MGRKKKLFIDKKNSATYRLLARDTSTFPAAADASAEGLPSSDRVFVRVDTNQFQVRGIFDDDGDEEYHHADPETSGKKGGDDVDSIFADAAGETDDEEDSFSVPWPSHVAHVPKERASHPLPDEARREILELGLPDDGYNYLQHLREISNQGGGSAYYENSKARLDLVPLDVKAYDASRVKIRGGESKKDPIHAVASKSVGVKVQKVVDPDVVRLLDDSDLSRFGSDVEDLDEDFVFKANLPDGNEGETEEVEAAESGDEAERKMSLRDGLENESLEKDVEDELNGGDKPRIHRPLDEQFDLLALQEYNDDSGYDDDGYMDMKSESLDEKLHDSLKDCKVNGLEVEGQYRVPGDYVYEQEVPGIGIQLDASTDVICRCREYAEKYCNENEDDEEIFEVEDSSDESEIWDCETIVSTYSNLDNHPGKIQAPENSKKKLVRTLPVDSIKKTGMIELRGKERLPVDFLPSGKKNSENLKKPIDTSFEKQKIRTRREESKDMKKERKAAVKVERREARRVKKELKGLYRCESHKAQKVASISMPSAIHLM